MPIEVELVHAEPGRRVVRARLIGAEGHLASALGEGSTAEEAEERARARLQQPAPMVPQPQPMAQPPAAPQAERRHEPPQPRPEPAVQPPAEAAPAAAAETLAEPAPDPEDWSSELAQLDLQLKRLGWSRELEATYLVRAFGHGSRSRLTTYADLLAYLRALEGFAPGEDPASCSVPLKRSDLLAQSDQLLGQLGWDANRGRQLLEQRFQRNSRQQLSDNQLLEFNMLLEGELLGPNLSNGSAAG
ncbi:MAG: hypothetical protein VKL97_06410 [Cyanobacteriota bacterium]|nr:hypothetical protein [Cyanobacteriota bacterium]